MLLKLAYNNKIHIAQNFPSNYEDLLKIIEKTFKFEKNKVLDIYYKDFEEDQIMITCDDDVNSMLEVNKNLNKKHLKIFVSPSENCFEEEKKNGLILIFLIIILKKIQVLEDIIDGKQKQSIYYIKSLVKEELRKGIFFL